MLSWGWRRRAIAFGSGAVGALAMPPFALFPLMIVPMSVAVWLIDGSADRGDKRAAVAGPRAAFGAGWWLGFGYFTAGLWWVGAACLVDAERFIWALPLGVVALPAALAFFPAFGFALARLLWSSGSQRVFALAFGLGLSEWARGLLFTGFPWNDVGMALGANLTLAQVASLVGLHGLTFLAIAIFAAPATLCVVGQTRFVLAPTIFAALALLLTACFGVLRLDAPPSPTVPGAKLRLIQPNVSQGPSFAPENKNAILHRYFALSDGSPRAGAVGMRGVTHLIWPESAFPFILARDAQALGDIADFLRGGATLITGAARVETNGAGEPAYYNSIEVLDGRGLARERYDKQHLVPFGEYVPFERWLERIGITQFVQMPGGFAPGLGARALKVPGLPVATPLICYEAIFPIEIGDAFSGARRSDWMLNLTDDAWFGLTPGPYQHYAQARLRAIELGLPLVRAANSGISAVVDGLGRETAFAPLGEAVLDFELPKPLPPTFQSRFGSLGAALIAVALLGLSLVRLAKSVRT
ncbi:MAG TPA: apolipoprotein N-acyltransferase [Roseiarcus sp.]|nr:apolipoprotein N-acyltransferase [Roseiarcus sp.]